MNEKDEKVINKYKRKRTKQDRYITKKTLKQKVKNSQEIINVKDIDDKGIIYLKTGEVAKLIEVKAIDLSLASRSEKTSFFTVLKTLYQVKNLNLKCYKLDQKLNLNDNKISLDELLEKYKNDQNRYKLLEESRNLIDELEEKEYTVSSVYYWIVIAKDLNLLEKQIDEINDILYNIIPRIITEEITNKLEIYKFLSNLYITDNSLDSLVWSDIPELLAPINVIEKTNMLKLDDKDIQLVTIKSVPPFVDELFFEDIFNYPNVRASINIKDSISQEELIRWVNSQYQFLLSDRNTTKKLSDATELDTQKENFQILMNDIKTGDEKIKEVSLVLILTGDKKQRDDTLRELKRIADSFQIKLDIPRLRKMEAWQSYDLSTKTFEDYCFYLHWRVKQL